MNSLIRELRSCTFAYVDDAVTCSDNFEEDMQDLRGTASSFRRYIENFAKIASPLTKLTTKTERFEWRAEHQNSFDELKTKLSTAPVLAAPIPSKPYEIHVDGSLKAIAARLLQENGKGKTRYIAFASRCLNKHERNYSVIELEMEDILG
ncbi:hypothetical protein OESDEN_01646 [Oesophagostomum dentatum]|uniref:Reverse transcriptase/retrotransposon-derived protein RNase H-like domain-containing protein n=1 Tax=Oesophagostomum dentatum TaxID=61180 RepID=A0A0B1TLD7_OESDE|nr:hypothetical protein OESDEN_01646 [Oesophagostomum dentatum]